MKDSWEMKNDFVNLLFEKGYLTKDEHRYLLYNNVCNGDRFISVWPNKALFKDNAYELPFLNIAISDNKLFISIMKNGRIVESNVVEV